MDSLLRTRFEQPNVGQNLVSRQHLISRLTQSLDKRVIMISAPAGYGKTSLLAQWLHDSPHACAWLFIDLEDNDLFKFLTYLISALQTVQPHLCKNILEILKSPHLPPLSHLSTLLINELSNLPHDVILVLEDYHLIRNPDIHQIIALLVNRQPHRLHLVISTRIYPPLPLLHWRAHGYITELRMTDLRFTHEEADKFLTHEIGVQVPDTLVDDLLELTEGWITGLKLAAIVIRERAVRTGLEQQFKVVAADIQAAQSSRQIVDYLLEDVFSRQPRAIREFLMRTSILNQLTAPLCDALDAETAVNGKKVAPQSSFVLKWIERSNLFIVSLDSQGRWYRYHSLFRELLMQQLRRRHTADVISGLHLNAGVWLEREGFIEEAFGHLIKAEKMEHAADFIERHRHALLNNGNWRLLDHWLDMIPGEVLQRRAGLLVARAYVMFIRGNVTTAIDMINAAVACLPAGSHHDSEGSVLHGELESLMAQRDFFQGRCDESAAHARKAIEGVPREYAYVRGSAVAVCGLCLQATGKDKDDPHYIENISTEDAPHYGPTALRALLTLAWVACNSGEWGKAQRIAEFGFKVAESRESTLLIGWSRLFLGWAHYQHNELEPALAHFEVAAQNLYGAMHKRSVSSALCGLALTQLALGKPEETQKTVDLLIKNAHEVGDAGLLMEAEAFLAHLALQEDNVAQALYWARTTSDKNDFQILIWTESPLVTRLRAFIADGTPESLAQAKARIQPALDFARATQNVWRQVELMALQSLLLKAEREEDAALDVLDATLTLAEPGRFIRVFVDLGEDMHKLMAALAHRKRHVAYVHEILMAYDVPRHAPQHALQHTPQNNPWVINGQLIEPLTARETEILNLLAQHLTNGEIASALFISDVTVKSHIRNLFGKLGVNRRRFAIMRAKELGLIINP